MYEFLYYRVRHVMTRSPVTLRTSGSLADVESVFESHDFNGVPVVGENGELLGVVTKLDFLKAFVFTAESVVPHYEEILRRAVATVMTREPRTVDPDMPLTRVLEDMVSTRYKSFPVVEDGRVVGVVAREDVLRALRHAAAGEQPKEESNEAGLRRVSESSRALGRADLFEAIHTLRAVRRFRPEPIADAVLERIVEAATRAASARNTQPWHFIAVRDAKLKARLGELYLQAWRAAQSYTERADADADIKGRPDYAGMMRSVDELAVHLGESPVLVLACLDTRKLGPIADGNGTILSPQSAYASIFPAVQNLMLAARALGLGSTLTTLHFAVEAEIRALLGIPSHIHIAALIPLGYPHTPFRVTKRKPVGEVLHHDRWVEKG